MTQTTLTDFDTPTPPVVTDGGQGREGEGTS